jgi:thiol-disulfide isomerase/thioredoxin
MMRCAWACSAIALVLATAGCSRRATRSDPPAPAPSSSAAPAARATSTELRHGIHWFRDDAESAFATAKREGKALIVDLWAPWCHTCLSMQEFVLRDANLPHATERFVFLAVDTERAENAAFLEKYSVSVWPTFYVIDPVSRAVRGRWLGAASASEFSRFLDEGARAVELGREGQLGAEDPRALQLAGDELAARREFAGAAAKYGAALERAAADWAWRPAVLVARMSALSKAKSYEECAALGERAMTQTGSGVSAGDFASFALSCAEKLPKGDARATAVQKAAELRLTTLCDGNGAELTADDRADACANLDQARTALGDAAGARRAVEAGLAVLEAAAADVPDDVALTFDRARSDFLVSLGRGEEALSLLARREQALPDNYNPPHQLARVYRSLKRWDEAIAAIERALGRAYGPRRANLMTLQIELLVAAGRKAEAKVAAAAQVEAYRALPDAQKPPEAEAAARDRLKQL